MWGFFPVYFKFLRPSGAVEILAHRIFWSCLFMAVLLTAVRRWSDIRALVGKPATLGGMTVAALLIGLNWGAYIWAVNADRIVETALGYFITPLVMVLLGMLVLGERLRSAQWVAVGMGTVAVIVLTVDYGQPPWIAFILAASFGLYSLTKKRLGLPPADGLLVESAVLVLPAMIVLGFLAATSDTTFGHVGVGHTVAMAAAGAITAVPLLMFAGAANRIPMIGLGMLQYVGPTIQLILGVFVFHEPMPPVRLIGFGLVWVALAIFTWDSFTASRRAPAPHSRAILHAQESKPTAAS